ALGTQLLEGSAGIRRLARRQNSGPRPRGFLTELALIKDFDTRAVAGEEISRSQADDAAAHDQHVGMPGHAVVICAPPGRQSKWPGPVESGPGQWRVVSTGAPL